MLDLLDDWTIHPLFRSVAKEVTEAYSTAFDKLPLVTANSEGTVELAHRFGRSDVILIPNGVDQERFTPVSKAHGARTVIGYGGKIGFRVDTELVASVARALPNCDFVFAGPVMEKQVKRALSRIPNCRLMGDVHYNDYPAVLETWDIGWVPHRVGDGEVGGDAIKIYEYCAAGLPTVSSRIIGADRLASVSVASTADEFVDWIRTTANGGPRVPRLVPELPREHTWKFKAEQIDALIEGI